MADNKKLTLCIVSQCMASCLPAVAVNASHSRSRQIKRMTWNIGSAFGEVLLCCQETVIQAPAKWVDIKDRSMLTWSCCLFCLFCSSGKAVRASHRQEFGIPSCLPLASPDTTHQSPTGSSPLPWDWGSPPPSSSWAGQSSCPGSCCGALEWVHAAWMVFISPKPTSPVRLSWSTTLWRSPSYFYRKIFIQCPKSPHM